MSGKDDDTPTGPPEDDDRTRIARPFSQGDAGHDRDRAQPLTGPDDDAGRTRLIPTAPPQSQPPSPSRPGSVGDDDDDRTRIAGAADPAPRATGQDDPDRTGSAPPPPVPQPTSAAMVSARRPGGEITVRVGTLINNNYEITAILKSGGMGEVYRGIELGTGDPVAIKAILPDLAEDEKAGLLFKREARTLRQLSDDAIVRYYNYVHDRDLDRYFLVMEFIEGVPLSDHVKSHGAIPVAAARTMLKRLARGLHKAHLQGVIHRDLSPDNVMLPDGIVGEARLIDFGIAKSNVLSEGTVAGQFAGKFKYVAPEQLGHYDGRITAATDIYGLALMICAAVCGQPLDMGTSIVEAVQSRQAIPDLSAVPADLRPVLAHMLEPDPDHRPASMQDVIRELENPQLIPQQYREGLPLPPAMEVTGRGNELSHRPMPSVLPQPGLQVPVTTGIRPSPAAVTGPPQTSVFPHQPRAPGTSSPPPEEKKIAGGQSGWLLGAMAAVFLLVLGTSGWYAWDSGMLGGSTDPGDPQGGGADMQQTGGDGGLPARNVATREGFLATFDTGPCTYASRVSAGANAGMIESFSTTGEVFAGLPPAYEEAFGARPSMLPRQIDQGQCAALEFVRSLQGRGTGSVQMQLSSDQIASGEALNAWISVPGDQAIWVVLISPLGGVYNLTDRLSDPVGGQQSLSFGLNLATGEQAAPQLLLAVASDHPLARAAAAQDGTEASQLLPRVLEEIGRQGSAASAALGYVLLTPAAPADDAPANDDP